MRGVVGQEGVLDILRSVAEKVLLRNKVNVRIFGLEVFAGLDRLNVVAFLVHEVVKLQRGEIHRRLGTLRFGFHAVFLQQNTAICLKTNVERERVRNPRLEKESGRIE